MQFNVNWEAEIVGLNCYVFQPDLYNHYKYLEDDLRNVYNHIETGGCAAAPVEFCTHDFDDCNGWFVFPPANSGSNSFRFIDTLNKIYIDNIVLLPSS
jgi:hypothetical protein